MELNEHTDRERYAAVESFFSNAVSTKKNQLLLVTISSCISRELLL